MGRKFTTRKGSGVDKSLPLSIAGSTVLQVGVILFRRYKLQKLVSKGRVGMVWRAHDTTLNRDVALKLMPEAVARNQQCFEVVASETRRSIGLVHPHIARTFDLIKDDTDVALVSEYVECSSFADIQANRASRTFEPKELGAFLFQICAALEYAHEVGMIVHRDLHPSNIFVGKGNHLFLLDIGVNERVRESLYRVSHEPRYEHRMLAYMSPQQLRGEPPIIADDIYLLGATMFEFLTGTQPFLGGSITHSVEHLLPPLVTARRQELGLRTDIIPPHWDQVIAACLAKDVKDRPQSIRSVRKALRLEDFAPLDSTQVIDFTNWNSRRLLPQETIKLTVQEAIDTSPDEKNRSGSSRSVKTAGWVFASGAVLATWQLTDLVSGFTLFLGCSCLAYECYITHKQIK